MRTYFLSVAIICLSSAASAQEYNNTMMFGGQLTKTQLLAQKREERRQKIAQQRAEYEQRREILRQQREQSRQARLAARNGGFNNGFAMSNYGDSYQTTFSGGGSFGGGSTPGSGHQCSERDTDENTCLRCAVYGEDRGSESGMRFVVGTVKQRLASGRYGNSICDVVHGVTSKYPRGQFVGAYKYMQDDGKGTLQKIENSLSAPANGVYGFHSCKRNGVPANCRTSDGSSVIPDPYMTAEEIEQQAAEREFEMANIPDDQGAG